MEKDMQVESTFHLQKYLHLMVDYILSCIFRSNGMRKFCDNFIFI